MRLRKLPIGIQDFVSLREDGYLYVDKTAYLYKMATEGKAYFFARPRRFGKSLLCSALGAYLEGRRELFEGLDLAELESEWVRYPVLRLDLNAERYDSVAALHSIIGRHLDRWEKKYPPDKIYDTIAGRFEAVIEQAHHDAGSRVCVLIDEYDKPLLSTLDDSELHDEYKGILKPFFGVLKSTDAHLRLVFITGVTKFGQVSVFSDLNQLTDLSMHLEYAAMCGITEEELVRDFRPELEALAERQCMSFDSCLERVREWYDGYRFEEDSPAVFNPYSTLNLFSTNKFSDYWFQTGTPTFLVELLKKSNADLREIDGATLPASAFADYRAEPDRPLPVIYQSGYLTIKGYDPELRFYTLGYPNAEVRNGFLAYLLPDYTGQERDKGGFHIGMFSKELRAGDVDAFLSRLRVFFESIPYDLSDQTERHYHMVFYLVFTLLGQYIRSEVKSAGGRSDAVVRTADTVYVFEFKLNGTAEEALARIDDRGYLIPYEQLRADSGYRLVKVGVEFDPKTRNIGRWVVAG